MAFFASTEIELDHITLHAAHAGSGPLALFLHGITANAYIFMPVMQAMASRFRVVSIDMRGHGRSSKPATGYEADDYADDIAGVIRHFGGEPALLIGHALGARDALTAGARRDGLVAAVVALDFTPFIEPAVFDALEQRVTHGSRHFADTDTIRRALAERYPLMPQAAIERRVEFGYRRADGGWRPLVDPSAVRQTVTGMRRDIAPALAALTIPALLVRGALTRFVSKDAWTRTKALRPDVAMVEIATADHYVAEVAPAKTAHQIVQFWETTAGRA